MAKAQKNLRKEGDGELAAAEAAARAEFAKIDANNDGMISPEEFVAYKNGSAAPAASPLVFIFDSRLERTFFLTAFYLLTVL